MSPLIINLNEYPTGVLAIHFKEGITKKDIVPEVLNNLYDTILQGLSTDRCFSC